MSNVNPNHYKVAGRERQGEGILQERHRQTFAGNRARDRFESRQLPPAAMPAAGSEDVGEVVSAAPVEEEVRPTAPVRTRAAPRRQPAATGRKNANGRKPVKKTATKSAKKTPRAAAKKTARTMRKAPKPPRKSAKKAVKSATKKRAGTVGRRRNPAKASAAAKRGARRKRPS